MYSKNKDLYYVQVEKVDFRFLGHQGALPLMTPGGLDPSDTITITSTMAQPATRACAEPNTGTRLHKRPEVAQKRPTAVAQLEPEDVTKPEAR